MTRLLGSCALLLLTLAPSHPSVRARPSAPPRADDLAECLLRSTNDADRALLVQWMFAVVTLHPAVQSVATVSDSTRGSLNRGVAGLMERLLTVSCVSEARAALKNQGQQAFEASFAILGQIAARDMFADSHVMAGMEGFSHYLDAKKLQAALAPTAQ